MRWAWSIGTLNRQFVLAADQRAKLPISARVALVRRAPASLPGQLGWHTALHESEQCRGEPGCAAISISWAHHYALLTGEPAYSELGSPMQIMFAHCDRDPPDPRAAKLDIPESCAQIVLRAMAKNPGQRYASAGAMLDDLLKMLVVPGAITTTESVAADAATPVATFRAPTPKMGPRATTPMPTDATKADNAATPTARHSSRPAWAVLAVSSIVLTFAVWWSLRTPERTNNANRPQDPDRSAKPPARAAAEVVRLGCSSFFRNDGGQ